MYKQKQDRLLETQNLETIPVNIINYLIPTVQLGGNNNNNNKINNNNLYQNKYIKYKTKYLALRK